MIIDYHRQFRKNFRQRIKPNPALKKKYSERVQLFLQDPKSLILKDHQLVGDKASLRAFWITGDIRVTYKRDGNVITFFDVGSHNQVY